MPCSAPVTVHGLRSWTVVDRSGLPIGEVEQFLNWLRAVDRSSNTVRSYALHLIANVYVDATSSAVGVLAVWRAVEDSPGVSDVGRAGLEPATNGLTPHRSRWLLINPVFVWPPTDYVAR